MASFDVKALFTNISQHETIHYAMVIYLVTDKSKKSKQLTASQIAYFSSK